MLVWVSPKIRHWNQDLDANSLFRRCSQEALWQGGEVRQEGKSLKGELMRGYCVGSIMRWTVWETETHPRIVPRRSKVAEVLTHHLLSLFRVLMLLYFCPAQCWEKHAPEVRECTQATDTGGLPHVLECSESKLQSKPPRYRQHLLQCINPKVENHCLDWETQRESIFMLHLLSLLPLSSLPALCSAFSTYRIEEKGLISGLVMLSSGNYSCNNSSFVGSFNERKFLKSRNRCVSYISNLNKEKHNFMSLL